MANYTAADVKKLRELTGAGMLDCKNALADADGDFDKAVELLRITGSAKAAKRGAEREASNGMVASSGNALIELLACPHDRLASAPDELVDRPVVDRYPDNRALEQPAPLEPVERPERHHLRQVARDPEHHEDVRRLPACELLPGSHRNLPSAGPTRTCSPITICFTQSLLVRCRPKPASARTLPQEIGRAHV